MDKPEDDPITAYLTIAATAFVKAMTMQIQQHAQPGLSIAVCCTGLCDGCLVKNTCADAARPYVYR